MQAYIRYPQANGKFIYIPYDGSAMNKDQADAWINSLNYEQKKALISLTQPTLAAGYNSWKLRVSESTTPNPQIIVLGENTGYSEGSTDPGTTDPSNNINYDSQGDLGGYVSTT